MTKILSVMLAIVGTLALFGLAVRGVGLMLMARQLRMWWGIAVALFITIGGIWLSSYFLLSLIRELWRI